MAASGTSDAAQVHAARTEPILRRSVEGMPTSPLSLCVRVSDGTSTVCQRCIPRFYRQSTSSLAADPFRQWTGRLHQARINETNPGAGLDQMVQIACNIEASRSLINCEGCGHRGHDISQCPYGGIICDICGVGFAKGRPALAQPRPRGWAAVYFAGPGLGQGRQICSGAGLGRRYGPCRPCEQEAMLIFYHYRCTSAPFIR